MKRKTALYFYAETAAMRGRQFVIRVRPALIIYEVKKWDDIMKVGAYLEKLNAKEIHCDYISRASHYFTVEIHAIPEGELEGLGPNHIMRAVEWFCGTSLKKSHGATTAEPGEVSGLDLKFFGKLSNLLPGIKNFL